MLQLGQAERFHQRRHVDAEAPAQALLQAVPAADGIGRRARPGLDRAFLGWLLLVGAAELDPAAGCLQHGREVVEATRVVKQHGLADGAHDHGDAIAGIGMHRVLGGARGRLQQPGVGLVAGQRGHGVHSRPRAKMER